jgi:hypothetical protein
MKHKHAENMIAYAQDAMETDKPWERWQVRLNLIASRWHDMECECTWNPNCEYRRKPRTININGHEVPEPVREPLGEGDAYYYVSFDSLYTANGASEARWYEVAGVSRFRLDKGIIHLTRESAEIHAKALLSFTEKP